MARRFLKFLSACLIASLAVQSCFSNGFAGTGDARSGQQNQSSESTENSPTRWPARLKGFLKGPSGDEAEISSSDEITVIASRLSSFDPLLEDVPANVTYKSKEELGHEAYRTFQDAVEDTEGAILFDAVGNGLDKTFSLRGFPESRAVVFLVDGIRVNEVDGKAVTYPLLPMNDVESIQVDRGSSSPVYGSDAFAGVVHLTTRRPSEKPLSLFGGMEWSSFHGLRFNQGLSGSIQDRWTGLGGRFTYYFNGGRDVNDGFRENGEWRITNFDIKAGYELPDDGGGFRVGVKHTEDAISNPGELTLEQFHQNSRQSLKTLDGRKFKNTIVQMDANKKFWDNRINASILNYWRVNRSHFYTTSATFTDWTYGFDPNTSLVTDKSRATDLIGQIDYRDAWTTWLVNQTSLGFEYTDASNEALRQYAFQGNVQEDLPRQTERSAWPVSTALFWRETMELYERVIAYFGMRHDFSWLNTEDYLTPADNLSRRWHQSSASTGLTLKVHRCVDIFGNYSQGFRVPDISEIAPFAGTVSQNLNPVKSDSYEVGTRLRYKDQAQFKMSYFLIDMKDEIVFDNTMITAATPFGGNSNLGKSRRTGVEFRLDAKPVKEVKVYGSYTWMKAYVRETDADGVPYDGRALGQVPENRFTMGASAVPFQRFGFPLDGFRISMDGTFTGRQHPQSYESTDEANLDATGYWIKPYIVWNMMLSYEWRKKIFYFKVNNLFDESYYSRAIAAQSWGTSIAPAGRYLFVNPGAPREFVLGMKWEF
ncbi:MAG TPA: TonB-dependent receptor [Candidatus Omnitrophota bacterium]|nr:TonB-dependent receptor [Candidatus Omnitrophota bacterium]